MGAEPTSHHHLPVGVGGRGDLIPHTQSHTRVRIDKRLLSEQGIQSCGCAQCGRVTGSRRTTVRFTQLPPMLMAFLPLSVAIPLLFPVLTGLIVSSRRKADIDMPLCRVCADRHLAGKRWRDVSATLAGGFAMCAPPLALFVPAHHLVVACAWALMMALSLCGFIAARRAFRGQVMLAESIDDDEVVFTGSDAWRVLYGGRDQPGVALEVVRG